MFDKITDFLIEFPFQPIKWLYSKISNKIHISEYVIVKSLFVILATIAKIVVTTAILGVCVR